jgi:hypothetical protein
MQELETPYYVLPVPESPQYHPNYASLALARTLQMLVAGACMHPEGSCMALSVTLNTILPSR